MKGFDLKNFKKIKSDQHTTTLAHPEGHTITIAHKGVNPKMREQLAALPVHKDEGGEVERKPKEDKSKTTYGTPEINTDKAKQVMKGFKSFGMAQGGMAPALKENYDDEPAAKYADGGAVDQKEQPAPPMPAPGMQPVVVNVNPAPAQPAAPPAVAGPNMVPMGTPPPAPQQADQSSILQKMLKTTGLNPPAGEAMGSAAQNLAFPGLSMGQPQDNAPGVPEPPAPKATPEDLIKAAAAAKQNQINPMAEAASKGYDILESGIKQQLGGIQAEAKAKADMEAAKAEQLKAAVATEQQQQRDYASNFKHLTDQYDHVFDDYKNGHIDPNKFWNSQSTPTKVLSTIGLILGGIGGGGRGNIALDYLNHQISQDIDAQKANLQKQDNLLSANLKQFGNLRDAADFMRAQQQGLIAHQLDLEAAKAGSPMAAAAAAQKSGELKRSAYDELSRMAMRRTILRGPASMEQKIYGVVPKEDQSAATKEAGEAREMANAKDLALSAFDDIGKFNTLGNRIASPFATPSKIKAAMGPVIAALSKATAGRFTEQDAKLLEDAMPKLTDSDDVIQYKRARLVQLLNEKAVFPTLNKYGIPVDIKSRFEESGKSKIPESAPVIPKK